MSEQQVLNIRAKLRAAGITSRGHQARADRDRADDRGGLPAQGPPRLRLALDSTRRPARSWCAAIFDNPNRALLPGFFVRVRVPTDITDKAALLVPDRVLAEDQAGKYLLVVGKDDVVEQRRVTTGMLLPGGLRVIDERPEAGRPGRGEHQRPRDPGPQGRAQGHHPPGPRPAQSPAQGPAPSPAK